MASNNRKRDCGHSPMPVAADHVVVAVASAVFAAHEVAVADHVGVAGLAAVAALEATTWT